MQITIITAGSRWDVQPFVALGQGFWGKGHQVSLCTHSSFEKFVTQYGLEYRSLSFPSSSLGTYSPLRRIRHIALRIRSFRSGSASHNHSRHVERTVVATLPGG